MHRPLDEQPIAALASGSGPGAVGVIRLSGPDCFNTIKLCFDDHLPSPEERRATLRSFKDPLTKEVIDELVTVFFKGPRSFTGQDTVELFCHGGPYIIQRILRVLYSCGVRPALPGEFSKRALLNGKLDITAAEGIKDLVEAQSRQQWLAGRQLYTGRLKDQIEMLRREIIGAMAYLEAMIDFPDEGDTQSVRIDDVRRRVAEVSEKIQSLASTFNSGKVASQGLMVAIAGAPNAGKSTLLNTLLGKHRAIVSEIAGTTRDYLEESCLLDGRLIRLVDTAGIRSTDDAIEREGVQLSAQIIQAADVVISLKASNSSQAEREALDEILSDCQTSIVEIMTKADLMSPVWAANLVQISCKAGEGLNALRQVLIQLVDSHTSSLVDKPFLTSLRQFTALETAQKALLRFHDQYRALAGHEMLAFELLETSRALSSVIGDVSSEDLLDKIFSEFCIGK